MQQQQEEEQQRFGQAHDHDNGVAFKGSDDEEEEEDDLFFTQTQEDGDEEWAPESGAEAPLLPPYVPELGLEEMSSTQRHRCNFHLHHRQQQQHHHHHQPQQRPAPLAPLPASNATAAAPAFPVFGHEDSSACVTGPTDPATGNTSDTRHFYTFLNDKAGMDENKRSKEEVEKIVHEASKNSKFFLAQQRNDVKIQERIRGIKSKLRTLSEPLRRALESEADKHLIAAEKSRRSYTQVCVVIDLDAFFTSVEERDEPSLKAVPFAVGGGVICTANYEARKYGVRSAMPEFIARKLCPQLLVRQTRFETYSHVAEQTRMIFKEYDPHFRAGSLDEAYLDLTACVQGLVRERGGEVPFGGGSGGGGISLFERPEAAMVLKADGEEEEEDDDEEKQSGEEHDKTEKRHAYYWSVAEAVVAEIRRRICEVTGVTASAGIATSFCLAKIASNERKPDGQYRVGNVGGFLRHLPVRKVSGIGRITERCLVAGLEIGTCWELWSKRALLYHVYTHQTAHWLVCKSVGLDGGGPDDGNSEDGGGGGGGGGRKGISRERTFAALSRKDDLLEKLRMICDSLAADMAREGLKAKSITLKLKNSDFAITTRAKSCAFYVSTSQELYQHSLSLLLPQLPITLRLMGVRASHFQPKPQAPPKGQGCLEGYVVTSGPNTAVAAGAASGEAAAGDVSPFVSSSSYSSPSSLPAASQSEAPIVPPAYSCPVCSRCLSLGLHDFNQHVDDCLRASDPHFHRRQKEQEEKQEKGKERRKLFSAPPQSTVAYKKGKRNGAGGGREGGGKKRASQPVAKPLEHFFRSTGNANGMKN